jgi:hypothetical protein
MPAHYDGCSAHWGRRLKASKEERPCGYFSYEGGMGGIPDEVVTSTCHRRDAFPGINVLVQKSRE